MCYPNQATGSLGARRGRIAFASLRTIVQRTTPSFTVEVRRTSRRGTGKTAQTWLAESKPQISESTRMSLLAADAPFRTAPAEEPSQEIAPPHHVGRILPSLIDEDAANWALRDSSASEQEAPSPSPRRQGKPRHGGVTASVPQRNSQPATEADALAVDNGAKAQASDSDPSPNQTVAQARSSAKRDNANSSYEGGLREGRLDRRRTQSSRSLRRRSDDHGGNECESDFSVEHTGWPDPGPQTPYYWPLCRRRRIQAWGTLEAPVALETLRRCRAPITLPLVIGEPAKYIRLELVRSHSGDWPCGSAPPFSSRSSAVSPNCARSA